MKKVCFLVILVTMVALWVAILVAPVAAKSYEGGTVPGGYSHQESSSSDGYVPAPGGKTASAKAEAKATATVNFYQQAPPARRHYYRSHYTAPKPRPSVKRTAYHAPTQRTHAAPAKSQAKPGKPFLTNKAGGSAFGVGIPNSTIAVTPNGVVVKVMKGIMSGRPGSEWQWAAPGRTLSINRPIGSLLRFIVAVRNTDSSELPTDGIYVRDDLASKLNSRAETGALFMGATKIRDLSADELTQLTSGVKIPVKQYVDVIPAKGTLGIRYDVRIAGGTGGSQDPEAIVPTDDNPGATGVTGPSLWSKIADNLKKFDWRWLLLIPIIAILWWLIGRLLGDRSTNDDDDEPAPPDPDDPPQRPRPVPLFPVDDPPAAPAGPTPPIPPESTEDAAYDEGFAAGRRNAGPAAPERIDLSEEDLGDPAAPADPARIDLSNEDLGDDSAAPAEEETALTEDDMEEAARRGAE